MGEGFSFARMGGCVSVITKIHRCGSKCKCYFTQIIISYYSGCKIVGILRGFHWT